MMNKNGFTLVELLAVITIVALLSLIAIPNIVGLTDGIRKDNMLDDAKRLISLAKYQVNKDYGIRVSREYTFYFNTLNANGDITNDPDGGDYNASTSYVKYTNNGTVAKYCIVLNGSKRHIGSSGNCIEEARLYSRKNVVDN